jgi:hypothetical protein
MDLLDVGADGLAVLDERLVLNVNILEWQLRRQGTFDERREVNMVVGNTRVLGFCEGIAYILGLVVLDEQRLRKENFSVDGQVDGSFKPMAGPMDVVTQIRPAYTKHGTSQ